MKPIIFNELKKYVSDNVIRFDVPGHKGNYLNNDFVDFFGENIIKADVNSMDRLDNLNYSKGIIKESQFNIARLHKAQDCRFLINGTTIGIQTMILSSVKPGEKILIPKNIHKSVESSLILSGAVPIYLDVEFDCKLGIYTYLNFDTVKEALVKHNNIKACLLINPSYYGINHEFKEIVKLLKKNEIIVLVDEAHGGNLYFDEKFPITAMEAGADMSCISYHKTLGTLTQTSLLLFNSNIVNIQEVDKIFSMLTTTSPSYLFITNLEVTIIDLFENKKNLFNLKLQELKALKKEFAKLNYIRLITKEDIHSDTLEQFRLLISFENLNLSGFDAYKILRDEYNIQVELGELNIILCIVTIFDDLDNIKILLNALQELENNFRPCGQKEVIVPFKCKQNVFTSSRDYFYQEKELVNYKDSLGLIAGESMMIYPPGIPLIFPGEKITNDLINYVDKLLKNNEKILGMYEKKIMVLKELR